MIGAATSDILERSYAALKTFVDPCSEGIGRPVSVVDLGLIEGVRMDGDAIHVNFCPTGPSCFFQISMMQEMERLVSEAVGMRCEVTISDEVWTPDRMSAPPTHHQLLPISPRTSTRS